MYCPYFSVRENNIANLECKNVYFLKLTLKLKTNECVKCECTYKHYGDTISEIDEFFGTLH